MWHIGRTNQRLEARIKHVPTKIQNFNVDPTNNLKNCRTPYVKTITVLCLDGWDCISVEGVRLFPNECPGYDTKQSDGEVPVMLELWGMWSTPSLPLLPGPL